VQNNGGEPLSLVAVTATLYDDANKVIGTRLTFTDLDVIFPGDKAPFDLTILRREQWEQIRSYTLTAKGEPAEKLPYQDLTLLSQSSALQGDALHVQGTVQNTGQTPARVKLVLTLYDADNRVINTGWSYTNASIIAPGGVAPFEVQLEHRTDPDNYHFRIQMEGKAVE
jgi:hypothetical protein